MDIDCCLETAWVEIRGKKKVTATMPEDEGVVFGAVASTCTT